MKALTRDSYAVLFLLYSNSLRFIPTSAACRPLLERDLISDGDTIRLTDTGTAFANRLLANPVNMPLTAKRSIAENDDLRGQLADLFANDPDQKVRIAMFGTDAMEIIDPPMSPDGLRMDAVYSFTDLDNLPTTWVIRHLYSGFNPDHPVIIREATDYTDPITPVIDSLNMTELRRRGDIYRYATKSAKDDYSHRMERNRWMNAMRLELTQVSWVLWSRCDAKGRLATIEAQWRDDGPYVATVIRDTDGHITGLAYNGRTYPDVEKLADEWKRKRNA